MGWKEFVLYSWKYGWNDFFPSAANPHTSVTTATLAHWDTQDAMMTYPWQLPPLKCGRPMRF